MYTEISRVFEVPLFRESAPHAGLRVGSLGFGIKLTLV